MSICVAESLDIALLGCGTVGSAFARLTAGERASPVSLNITGALVRDPNRTRELPPERVFADARALLAAEPRVVVELLGGIEPARTLVLEALRRRIAVVTANKSLIARHGGELRRAAAEAKTPLLYEAAVISGVPFLGTFARRRRAAAVSSVTGIVNGTCNYILSRCADDGWTVPQALADSQRRGYAEPDPHNDVAGIDAAEKLGVLLQHFASRDVDPDSIETTGIETITTTVIAHARALGGVIKPLVSADWTRRLEAFAGPAFVPAAHVLARVDDVENALLVNGEHGRLLFQGPGAGPDVTAATVLDDVREVAAGMAPVPQARLRSERAAEPVTSWFVSLDAVHLPRFSDIADLLASYGVFTSRVTNRASREGHDHQSFLVFPAERGRLDGALLALRNAVSCSASALRALEVPV